MKITAMAGLTLLGLVECAIAQDGQWITFKTAHNSWGRIDHQIDMRSIRRDGGYTTFWSREWIADKRQPMMFTLHEALFAVSLKYAVDCTQHRFGSHFIDSDNPIDRKTGIAAMQWQPLEKFPVLDRNVCGAIAEKKGPGHS